MPTKPRVPAGRAVSKPKAQTPPRVHPDPAPDSAPETRINLRGDDNAVAVGPKSFAANIKVIFQGNWRPFAAVLFVVAVLLGTILWFVIPKQSNHFSAQFGVAVAEFLVQDENGNAVKSDAGRRLAESIASQMDANFKDMRLDTVTTYEIWGPKQTGALAGEEEARQFALSTGATMVVYGQVKESNGVAFFTPRFFVNQSAFQEAEELTGQHDLGRDVQGKLDASMILAESPGVQARVEGLSMLTIGLVYYSVDNYEQALEYFQKADNPEWVGSGKETVYLLIGNVYIRQASDTGDFSALSVPEKYYQDALDIDPNYGRAMIGEANILYLRAYKLDDCDPAGLEAASALLDQSLTLTGQPASANIETKVHFYRGQIAIIRDACKIPGADWRSSAEQEFAWVTARYESNPESEASQGIQYFASHAYARLGYLAYLRNDAEAAIAFMQKAIPIAPAKDKADYLSLLGDYYIIVGQTDQALKVYQQALAIAIGNGDAAKAEKFQQKLDSVGQ